MVIRSRIVLVACLMNNRHDVATRSSQVMHNPQKNGNKYSHFQFRQAKYTIRKAEVLRIGFKRFHETLPVLKSFSVVAGFSVATIQKLD